MVNSFTVCIVLSLTFTNNWQLRQIDVNDAFLNGEISEEVYMVQPSSFEQRDTNGNVLICKLDKAIYGLK